MFTSFSFIRQDPNQQFSMLELNKWIKDHPHAMVVSTATHGTFGITVLMMEPVVPVEPENAIL